jgi:hypothetical protein
VAMIQEAAAQTPEREAPYDRSDAFDMAQLWERPHGLVIAHPMTPGLLAIRHYRNVSPYLIVEM